MQRRLLLPATLVAGMFTLTLTNPYGDAVAQVYILQGEQGPPGVQGPAGDGALNCSGGDCTLEDNLIVEGDLVVSGTTTSDNLTVDVSYLLTECPEGYARASAADIVLCEKDVGGGAVDERGGLFAEVRLDDAADGVSAAAAVRARAAGLRDLAGGARAVGDGVGDRVAGSAGAQAHEHRGQPFSRPELFGESNLTLPTLC